MKRMLCLLIMVIVVGCVTGNYVKIDGEEITVEVARTKSEKQKGLMFRDELCDNCGMLFVFDEESKHSFWMKNTRIPLDMIFIDSDLNVVDILHAAPCVKDPCKSYAPDEKASYVLETNLGKFDESVIGQKMKWVGG
ncbi:MAG: DUF192 domain-containing protein [Candidatus Woesearchaeota archaeon]|jgi:hypothetical protein|nr:DUF192 domain-containing protein [Candidatus Woesearchaeota archaeon]MDP7506566.1 DUF192 domain-containing protein [Candidatus Woesearchaeota archaeon]